MSDENNQDVSTSANPNLLEYLQNTEKFSFGGSFGIGDVPENKPANAEEQSQ
jgi:hypothetical protein